MAGDGVRHRRRHVLALALVGGLVAIWALWLFVSVLLASRDLRAGVRAIDDARRYAQPADIAAGRPLPGLSEAGRRFSSAHRRLSGAVWAPARVVPFVGRQIRSLTALSGAAGEVSTIGVDGVSDVRRLLERDISPANRVAAIRDLADVASRTEARLAAVRLGPRVALLPPLARRYNQLAEEIENLRGGLRKGAVAGRAGADLLAGPRRYLVFAANNAEMRAGAGMFLSIGELDTRDGAVHLGPMTSVEDLLLPGGVVPLTGDLADRWGWLRPNEDWRNLMLSPRFDASAELAAQMWVASGHDAVDGVLALDPVVLKALLAASVSVTTEGRTITADNVVEELLHAQYLRFPDAEQIPERREQLGGIARASFDALNGGPLSLPKLAEGFASAVRGRHLMAWSRRSEEQAAWVAAGMAGGLDKDSLLVAVLNRGGTKLDWFLGVSADLAFTPSGPNTDCTLRLVLDNRVPPGEPRYVAGPRTGSGVGPGVYLGIVSVTLPGSARDGRIDGVNQLAVVGADGPTRVVGFQVSVAPGESRTVVVRFVLPGRQGALTVEPTARVPEVTWTSQGRHWPDGESHRLAWH